MARPEGQVLMAPDTFHTPGHPLWTVTGEEGLHPTDLPNCCRRASSGKLDPFDCPNCGARWFPLLACAYRGCEATFADEGYEAPGRCGGHSDGGDRGCGEPFCEDHLYVSDAWGDDGSGQYVTDLPGPCATGA